MLWCRPVYSGLSSSQVLHASAPGRIVLFGEHQDYFHLPVIAAGINLRMNIEGQLHNRPGIYLELRNLRRTYSLPIKFPIEYRFRRAYIQSALNVLHRKGFEIPPFRAAISGNIFQNAGLSSSSALTVAWTQFLAGLVGQELTKDQVAQAAYEAEVLEFNEPGGPQDHYATALGRVHYFEFPPEKLPLFKPLDPQKLGEVELVIGNSQTRKATLHTIRRIKHRVFNSARALTLPSLATLPVSEVGSDNSHRTLRAILKIRDMTLEGRDLFNDSVVDGRTLGRYLTAQHTVLRDELFLSIPRIEGMIEGALEGGAYGAKINGSGQGGCMIAVCPPDAVDSVMDGIRQGRGVPVHAQLDEGVTLTVREEAGSGG